MTFMCGKTLSLVLYSFILKKREAHKSSGRAECSQKAVDVWIASTASSLPSVLSPWLASVKSLAIGTLQDHLQKEYQKDFFMLLNTPVLFKWPHSLLIACLNKTQCWEGSPAILRFCPLSLLQVHAFTFKSAKFGPITHHLSTKIHCFCYQKKSNWCFPTFLCLCRAAFFSRKSITWDN